VAELGRVDIVVNNAGVSRPAPIEHLTEAELGLHLAVHLGATVATTAAAFHAMRATGGGRVINTVSGHGLEPRAPESSAYAAAKAAVFGFTRAAAIEAARIGVTVNAVAPLAFTRMSAGYLSQVPEAEERFDPAHVAAVVVFLASELARHVNGRVLRVEGPRVSEYRVGTSPAIEAAVWTPEALAERIGEVLGA
jgi:NAD(P)-dependent dehydrogenase (short-subunit alcohol dehydrogenase family)